MGNFIQKFWVIGVLLAAGCRSELVGETYFPNDILHHPDVIERSVSFDSFKHDLPSERIYPFDQLVETTREVDLITNNQSDDQNQKPTVEVVEEILEEPVVSSTSDKEEAKDSAHEIEMEPAIKSTKSEDSFANQVNLFDSSHVSVVRSSQALQFCEHIDSRLSSVSFRHSPLMCMYIQFST